MSKRLAEPRDDVGWNSQRADLVRIVLITRRPNTGFSALDRELAADGDAVIDVEARAAKLGDAGGDLDAVAEFHRLAAIEVHIDQR